MKRITRRSLNQKLFLIVSSFLLAIAALILTCASIFFSSHIEDYAKKNVAIQHQKFDTSLSLDLYEINYRLLDLFTPKEVEDLLSLSEPEKTHFLDNFLAQAPLPSKIDGLALYSRGRSAASSRLFGYPFSDHLDQNPLAFVDLYQDSLLLSKFQVSAPELADLHLFVMIPFSYYSSFFKAFSSDSTTEFLVAPTEEVEVKIHGGNLRVRSRLERIYYEYGIELGVSTSIDMSFFTGLLTLTLTLVIGATVLTSLLSMYFCYRLAGRITKPIKELSLRVGNFDLNGEEKTVKKKEKTKTKDEIYQLEESFDAMVTRITDLIDKNIAEAEQRRKLELESLQMQINPHFLYNTLDAIAWMAKIKREPQIEQLVLSLSQFFRISLHRGDKIITIREELELTEHYLEIEQIRFPDRFKVDYQIDETLLGYQTLKLILQPIVENAIKHGLPPGVKNARITISLTARGSDLLFTVVDNGEGFTVPPDILERQRSEPLEKGGYGLYNVNERIRLEYGEKYGIKVSSKPKVGTRIELLIPRLDH